VPVRLDRIRWLSRPTGPCWCHGSLTKRSRNLIEGDVSLCDDDGNVILDVRGVVCSALAGAGTSAAEQLPRWTYALAWQLVAPVAAAVAGPGRWLVLMDGGGVGASLTEQLYAQGAAEVIQVVTGATSGRESARRFQVRRQDRDALQEVIGLADIGACRGVMYLWGLDDAAGAGDPVGTSGAVDGLHLVQALAKAGGRGASRPRLYLVTSGAQQVREGEPITGLAQAPLVGLGRVAACEHPELRCTLVEVDSGPDVGRRLALELSANSDEDEVVLRGAERYVPRLVRASVDELEDGGRRVSSPAFGLQAGRPGSLDGLRFREIRRRAPGPGEVEVRIQAAALNFKDVLKVLGVLPEKALEHTFHRDRLGMEAAGVITRVGAGVRGYAAGDVIVASLPGSFSSHVTVAVDSLFAGPRPDFLGAVQAAGVPVAFMTAYYALHTVARLSAGETVLIHSAAGGVGLADIQVARWRGAEVFATAGSLEKREFLRSLGVRHVWDSRTLEFAEGVRAATGGRGVDVVLNSLPGEAMRQSLSVVAPFGRFVEIGKRDIVEHGLLPLLPFDRSLSFTAIDLDRMMVDRPDLIRRTLDEVWERVRARDFTPLPVTVFPAGRAVEAFRYLAQARQIGKVVIDIEDREGVAVLPAPDAAEPLRGDATYLVTGGFGGLGLEVAGWLAARGARHLALVGRRGPASPAARQVVEELRGRGVSVMIAAVDVSREEQVAGLLADIAERMPPLRGVFHAAAVLDDGLLTDLDAARWARVMAPKALGAWLLHEQTRALPLDFFVLFSSATAMMGNPGQGNYVAANAFLDALARYRRAQGLPAISIGWGALAGAGMLAENERAAERLARAGIQALPAASALEALSRILHWSPPHLAVMAVDWARWSERHPRAHGWPRLSLVLAETAGDRRGPGTRDVRAALAAIAPEARLPALVSRMAELVAETLHLASDQVDVHEPLASIGIDSLVGIELQAAIGVKLGVQVSLLELMRGENLVGTAAQLLKAMRIPTLPGAGAEATGAERGDARAPSPSP